MADLISNSETLGDIRAKLNATLTPYASRAAFESATVPAGVLMVYVIEAGDVWQLVRDDAGLWYAGDGSRWAAMIDSSMTDSAISGAVTTASAAAVAAGDSATAASGHADRAEAAASQALTATPPFDTVADMVADATSWPVGAAVAAGGFRFRAVDPGDGYQHLNAGGAALQVIPFMVGSTGGVWPLAAALLVSDGSVDVSAEIQSFMQFAVDHGGGQVVFPPWDMLIDDRVVVVFPNTVAGYLDLTLIGSGNNSTRFIGSEANTAGGIKIIRTARNHTANARDFGFFTMHPKGDETSRPMANGGIALWMASTWQPGGDGWGDQTQRQVDIQRILIGGEGHPLEGPWAGGIKVDYAFRPLIHFNTTRSAFWGTAKDDGGAPMPSIAAPANGDTAYSFGIDIVRCYAPDVRGNIILGRYDTGLTVHDYQGASADTWEMFWVTGNEVASAITGCHIQREGAAPTSLGQPGGFVGFNHFNGHRCDFVMEDSWCVSVMGNFILADNFPDANGLYAYPDATGFTFINVTGSTIWGNQFGQNGHYTDPDDCFTAIRVGGESWANTLGGNSFHVGSVAYRFAAGTPAGSNTVGVGDVFGWPPATNIMRYPRHYIIEDGEPQNATLPEIEATVGVAFGGASSGMVVGQNALRYTRSGGLITINLALEITTKGPSTGELEISVLSGGLAPSMDTGLQVGALSGLIAPDHLRAVLGTDGALRLIQASGAALTDADISDGFTVTVSGSYQAALTQNTARMS